MALSWWIILHRLISRRTEKQQSRKNDIAGRKCDSIFAILWPDWLPVSFV